MSEKHAYTIEEFCKAYGIGRTFVYKEISAGRLRVKKAGRRTIILAADAKDWRESLPDGGKRAA